ncbi:MAG TPA: glycosyl hydrolase family 18 protein [Candidatus Dormibacteraeota bacterium]
MRIRLAVGLGAIMSGSLLLLGFLGPGLSRIPLVNVDTLQLDGASLQADPVSQVSTRPTLAVRVSQPLAAGQWQVALDGRRLATSVTGNLRQLRLTLPGPMTMGSRHSLQVVAGAMQVRTMFEVVPPLVADVAMHLYHLTTDSKVTVAASVRFARPVESQADAQRHVSINGNPSFQWRDPQTLDIVSTGFNLSDHAVVTLSPGVVAADGSWSEKGQAFTLTIPSTITQVLPGRMVQMYYVNTDDGHASLFAHLNQIDVLSPQWYDANADGSITGHAFRDVIDAAHANGIALIPLVVNKDVDPGVGHAILADPAKRAALAQNLVNEAKTYGYAGFQLDFEQIPWTDRDLLTALVQDCAQAFHPAGLNLSIAVIPRLPGDDSSSEYFQQWSGAYDFGALAKAADFISFMTYDEHNGVTGSGPVSGTPWMRQALEYSLQGVPPEKATLGLPTYYRDWTASGYITSSSFADAMTLAQQYGGTPAIDPAEQELHFGYDAYGMHHELWIQSTDTLRMKLPLIYEYGLKGISVWRLGFEDASFWSLIPPRR